MAKLNLTQFFGCLVWQCCAACGILVPCPGIGTRAPELGRVLTTGLPGNPAPLPRDSKTCDHNYYAELLGPIILTFSLN